MRGLPAPLAVYALNRPGAVLARRLAAALEGAELFLPSRLAGPGERGFSRLGEALARNFTRYRGHVLFAASGLVVRALAGLLKAKDRDPAVVVVDPAGRFAVSLLSGHLGGANRLARETARILGGQAVITTATDGQGLPSLEVVAVERGCRVENLPALARFSTALLEGRRPGLYDPAGWLAPALAPWGGNFSLLERPPGPAWEGRPLAWVHWGRRRTPASWLVVRPPALVLGLGCNRGTPVEALEEFLLQTLAEHDLAPASLAILASVEAKRDEPGLLELARRRGLECVFFPATRLAAVEVPTPSALVDRHMGTASVCEAAALLAAGSRRLLVKKRKTADVTLALALRRPPGDTST